MDREDKTPCDECGVLEHERSMNFVGDKFVCYLCEENLIEKVSSAGWVEEEEEDFPIDDELVENIYNFQRRESSLTLYDGDFKDEEIKVISSAIFRILSEREIDATVLSDIQINFTYLEEG